MANAVATLTRNGHPYGTDNTQRRDIAYGILGLSAGGTYITNGVPLTWGQLAPMLTTKSQAAFAEFFSTAGGGYQYVYDQTHNSLRIFLAGVELANGAAITADTIGFKAEFLRGI